MLDDKPEDQRSNQTVTGSIASEKPIPEGASVISQTHASQQNASESPESAASPLLNIAVIGDVMTDWAFISKEPARARFPVFKPWTRDASTHLFALPAGAWLSGPLIQGALSEAYFERTHTIKIKQNAERTIQPPLPAGETPVTHIVLSGSLPAPQKTASQSLDLIFDGAPAEPPFHVIINDEVVVNSNELEKVAVTLRWDSRSHSIGVEAGLTNAVLKVGNEYDDHPGYFNVDQVGRFFECENTILSPDPPVAPLRFTFLTLTHAALTVKYTYRGGQTSEEALVYSLRVVPKTLRQGHLGTTARFSLQPTSGDSLHMKKSTIEVIYGELRGRTHLDDYGKLVSAPLKSDVARDITQPFGIDLIGTQPRRSPYRLRYPPTEIKPGAP